MKDISPFPVHDSTAGNSSKASTEISAQALAVGAHCSWTGPMKQQRPQACTAACLSSVSRLCLPQNRNSQQMLKETIRNRPGYSLPAPRVLIQEERVKEQGDSVNNAPETRTLEENNASPQSLCKRGNSRWLNPLSITACH